MLIGSQRNFEPMRKHEEAWQRSKLTDVTAKVVIYRVVEGKLEAPKHLVRIIHELYFEPNRHELEVERLHFSPQRPPAHYSTNFLELFSRSQRRQYERLLHRT